MLLYSSPRIQLNSLQTVDNLQKFDQYVGIFRYPLFEAYIGSRRCDRRGTIQFSFYSLPSGIWWDTIVIAREPTCRLLSHSLLVSRFHRMKHGFLFQNLFMLFVSCFDCYTTADWYSLFHCDTMAVLIRIQNIESYDILVFDVYGQIKIT